MTDRRLSRSTPRGTWMMRDRPVVLWLALAAVVALVHRWVPGATWLMVHLVLLGALTHSAMVWSAHFSQALLKTPESLDSRTQQSRRLVLLAVGTTLVLVGVPTSLWWVTLAGATVVAVAVVWHGVQLWRRLRRTIAGRFTVTIRYYLAAVVMLVLGAALGGTLAHGWDDAWRSRLLVAHSMVMLLGWLGLTVTGTLLTLWPTMLRTKMDTRAETLARQALPALVGAVLVIGTGSLLAIQNLTAAGLVAYALALCWWGRALVLPARTAPPKSFTTWSVAAALVWFLVAILAVTGIVLTRPTWTVLADGYGGIAAIAAVGFGAQILGGALSYLIPTVIGGGPVIVRAGHAAFDRLAVLRLVVVNVGLAVCLLPVPSAVRVAISVLVLVALVAYLPIMFRAIKEMVVLRRAAAAAAEAGETPVFNREESARRVAEFKARTVWSNGQLVAGIAALAVVASVAVAAQSGAAGGAGAAGITGASLSAGVTATGHTTTVDVAARDMRFEPSTITVPAGDRLVIRLTNKDATSPHDLAFPDGSKTPRLMPGRSATLDLGVVGASTQGWCTIVGHKQMGMVLDVHVTGGAVAAGGSHAAGATTPGDTTPIRLGQTPGPDFTAVDATLPPLAPERTHHVTLTVTDEDLQVAPNVWQRRWVFNGRAPGPTLHGRVGDTFVVTLVNKASMGHSLDFHAGDLRPDDVMRTIPPGGTLTYTFTAHRAGAWMYHCSSMPMSMHIAAGLFGAVVIEPNDLPPVARSYVLVQSEVYVDGDGTGTPKEVDAAAVEAERPDAVTFNGIANQYDFRPLPAKVGERVRIWVVDAGPNRSSSFHVVGSQFDTVWAEGAYRLRDGRDPLDPAARDGGAQALALSPGSGGFVELAPREAGHYPFVSHVMVDAERGAHGILDVTD